MPSNSENTFSFIVASDTQIPRALDAHGVETAYGDRDQSLRKNREQVDSMNLIISEKDVEIAIFNGDITEFGHEPELRDFVRTYSGLRVPIFLGLGNHDYENNVGDSLNNHCADRMISYVWRDLQNKNISVDYKQLPFPSISYQGSLMYGWVKSQIIFIQLHNYPTYTKKIERTLLPDHNITASLEPLRSLLATLRSTWNNPIIINLHNPFDGWNTSEFSNIINQYGVTAVFGGHIHKNHGKSSYSYGNVPLFYSGSAIYNTYLLATINSTQLTLTVDRYNSAGGNARCLGSESVPLILGRTTSTLSDNPLDLAAIQKASGLLLTDISELKDIPHLLELSAVDPSNDEINPKILLLDAPARFFQQSTSGPVDTSADEITNSP